MSEKIDPFEAGDEDRTALDTDAINELVDGINSWLTVRMIPEGIVKLTVAGDSATMEFPTLPVKAFVELADGALILGVFRGIGTFVPDPPLGS